MLSGHSAIRWWSHVITGKPRPFTDGTEAPRARSGTSGLAIPAHFSTIHARPRMFFSTGFPPLAFENAYNLGKTTQAQHGARQRFPRYRHLIRFRKGGGWWDDWPRASPALRDHG